MDKEPYNLGSTTRDLEVSCDRTMSRQEFIRKLVTKAAAAGTLVYGAAIADAFIAPPARAQVSGTAAVITPTTPTTTTTITITDGI